MRRYLAVIAGILLISTLCAGAQESDPVTLAATIPWLNSFLAAKAGFSVTRADGPGQEKLIYQFNEAASCHLNWQTQALGDDDLQRRYPGLNHDEDMAAIRSESIELRPFDPWDYIEGGEGNPAEGSTPVHWKLAGRYIYDVNEHDQALGLIFADAETALHAASVLRHAVELCRGPGPKELPVVPTCDNTPTAKMVIEGGEGAPPYYVNHNTMAVSCVITIYARYAGEGKDFLMGAVAFDLEPGKSGNVGNPGFSISSLVHDTLRQFECYPKGSVDAKQVSCADRNHPFRWNEAAGPMKK